MEENKDKVMYIPMEDILPNRFQPRLAFDEKELQELANSIIKYGVIQPIVVRAMGDKFEIIAGERRYKASTIAGLKKIPAIQMNTDDNTSAEIALLENIQRKNLSVIEEAQSYKKLIEKGFTQDDIAVKLGISQSSVANKMRLLNLPKEVQDALLYNRISERHARSLLSLNDVNRQKNLLDKIINEKLTVKQTEEEIAAILTRQTQTEDIPDSLMKFLTPEATQITKEELLGKNGVEEFLDIKVPEVVNIESEIEEPKMEEKESAEELTTPFQEENMPVEEIKVEEPLEPTQVPEIENFSEEPEIVNPFQPSVETVSSEPVEITEESKMEIPPITDIEIAEENPAPVVHEDRLSAAMNPFAPTPVVNPEDEEKPKNPESLLNEYGEVDLPKTINKVRDFVGSLDEVSNLISTTELDLPDKYQIIIEINKEIA